ncbi:MAG: chemotaxis protein CheC [Synergistaceae bacterium]|nr:chemotaxis protein CheC [Synergistaceae bacterium]
MENFSRMQLDALKEVGNIGAGNAATALSVLLNRPVDMDVPTAEIVSIYRLAEYYGDPLSPVSAVFVRSEGDFPCSLIFLQSEEDGQALVDLLLSNQCGDIPLEGISAEIRDSALAEGGNIILSAFLNAVNELTSGVASISVPSAAHDMLGAILQVMAVLFGQYGDDALIVDTSLRVGGSSRNIAGKIVLLPDPGSLESLFGKLRVF